MRIINALRKFLVNAFGSAEAQIYFAIEDELQLGVNGPALHSAFEAAQELNSRKKFGYTNNYLINLTERLALHCASGIEHAMYGGEEQTCSYITAEIEQMRRNVRDEEQ